MKKQILTVVVIAGFACCVHAQGTIYFDNSSNDGTTSPTAATAGVYFKNTGTIASPTDVRLTQDMNYTFLGGTSPGSLSVLVTSFGASSVGDNYGDGVVVDNSGNGFSVPGSVAGATEYFQIEAWVGSATSYAAASTTLGNFYGITPVFQNPTGNNIVSGVPQPPSYLTQMPSLVLNPVVVPEPSTMALAGLGSLAALMIRRKK
jgi:hypothetical protein